MKLEFAGYQELQTDINHSFRPQFREVQFQAAFETRYFFIVHSGAAGLA